MMLVSILKGKVDITGNPVIKYKEFRKTIKRDWSFKCGWCNKKVSSKKEDGYFSIIAFDPILTQTPIIYVLAQNLVLNIYGMTCSKIG
jgi:hypothetical protein